LGCFELCGHFESKRWRGSYDGVQGTARPAKKAAACVYQNMPLVAGKDFTR
jgi:hypothetical protein